MMARRPAEDVTDDAVGAILLGGLSYAVWTEKVFPRHGKIDSEDIRIDAMRDGLWSVDGLRGDDWVVIYHSHRIRDGENVLTERVPPPADSSRRDR
jgi:hypothetical protein